MSNCLNKLNKENKEVFIAGDFNIDLLKYDANIKYRYFYNLMTSSGFLPQITQPTRITETTMTIIDNIYTNTFTNNIYSGNLLLEIADHLAQFVCTETKIINKKTKDIFKRVYKNWNEQSFLNDLSIQNWKNDLQDVNDKYNDFLWHLESCVNRHAPIKKLNKKEIKTKNKPWITRYIQRKISHRNIIFARKKKKPDDEHLKSSYNKFRNSINRDIKKSKKDYYSSYFEECKLNINKTWKGIKELVNTKNNLSTNITQLKSNNLIIDDPKLISDTFNNFFVNVGPNTDNTIPKCFKPPMSYLRNRVNINFTVTPTTNAEVMTILLLLDDNKSTGISSIPTKLLKIAAPIIVPHLVSIINLSFIKGTFPKLMKLAKILPIFKSGSRFDVNNYRPISLLSVFSKILEKLMHNRLYSFLEQNNVIYI